ncbi:MAG: hypothetical protein AAGC55_10900 [Myxococcota bacterium]
MPWPLRLLFKLMQRKLGIIPGPVQALGYRPKLIPRSTRSYLMRGVAGVGPWSKSEAELFGAFVSHLNTCHF